LERTFHRLLRRLYIVLFQGGIFCSHLPSPFALWCHLVLGIFLLIFWLDDLCIGQREAEVSHYYCVEVYMWF
jgi:hypothetical protein